MGFQWEGGKSIESLFERGPLERAARRIANQVQEYLLDRVKEYTPIGDAPPGVDHDDWMKERGGRRPGTLRDSWEKGEVEILTAGRIVVTVLTHDPVAPYVEDPTRPHVIRSRTLGGILRFRDRDTGQVVFAREVHHPGTEGSYMLAKALQDTAAFWPEIVRDELLRWEREQMRAA